MRRLYFLKVLIRLKTKLKTSEKTKRIKDTPKSSKINAMRSMKAKTILEVRGGSVLTSTILSADVKAPLPTLFVLAALNTYLVSGKSVFISMIIRF